MFDKESNWTFETWWQSKARELLLDIPKGVVEWIWSDNMTDEEKEAHPEHETTRGYLKVLDETDCAQIWWDGLSENDRDIIRSLPNFDEEKFCKCVGLKLKGGD